MLFRKIQQCNYVSSIGQEFCFVSVVTVIVLVTNASFVYLKVMSLLLSCVMI